jgi:hypothetical protein
MSPYAGAGSLLVGVLLRQALQILLASGAFNWSARVNGGTMRPTLHPAFQRVRTTGNLSHRTGQ